MSIIHTSRGEYVPASWFIALAAGFDALDGIMARITKSSSEFGVEIDSLSDVISFGAAPAFLVYHLSLYQMEGMGILISSMLMVFAGLRLARFNVQLVGFDKDHFVGLPVPVSALTVASFTLTFYTPGAGIGSGPVLLLPWMVAILSLLMVSKVRYDTLPKISRRAIRREPWKVTFFALAVIVVFVAGGGAIFPILLLFIALGIIRSFFAAVKRLMHAGPKYDEDDAVDQTQIDT
jgi:CDP-diacylglycerol--serine O-phosphatidyltransferase